MDALNMVINHWEPQFTKLYGHNWPDSYLCIDTEFTGGNAEKDLIVEIGHTMVENGHVVDKLNLVLDWTNHPKVPLSWVDKAINRIHNIMGSSWRVTLDVMRAEGIHPNKALKFYYELMQTWKSRGLPFVAHNGFHADERMLKGHFEGFLGKRFRFGDNGLIDTGAIFKATQCLNSLDEALIAKKKIWLPKEADTLETYFRRVVSYPVKGVKWKLWNCIEYFGLDVKYQLNQADYHGASYDSYLTHLLMEEYRTKVTRNNSGELGVESPDALARMFDREMAKANEKRIEREAVAAQDEDEFESQQGSQPKLPKEFLRRRRQRSV